MSDMEAMRATAVADSEACSNKARFGLFSHPVAIAVGDDGPYKTKRHPRNDQGKPITQPRNLLSCPPRSGQLKASFFGSINSLAAGAVTDEYIDPDRKLLQIANETFKTGFKKESQFRPSSGQKTLHKPAYEYKEETNPEANPKRFRQEDGRVKSKPRNVVTNKQFTVVQTYFKPLKHLDDPYDRLHKTQVDKLMKDKTMEPEAPLKLNTHERALFNKDSAVYGEDVELKPKTMRETQFNVFKHESKWRTSSPAKIGYNSFFAAFPKYIESPPDEKTRKPKEAKTEQFRRMSIPLSRPSPSITQNPTNLRNTISHSFSHRV